MRALTFTIVGVAALFAAGCGGDGDRLSEGEFRQQANAICQKYDERLSSLTSPSSPDDVPAYVGEAIPLIEDGLGELRALEPPEDLQEDYDRMLDETEKAIPAARKLQDAAENQDPAALQEALQEGQQADEQSDEIAQRLGLDECASS